MRCGYQEAGNNLTVGDDTVLDRPVEIRKHLKISPESRLHSSKSVALAGAMLIEVLYGTYPPQGRYQSVLRQEVSLKSSSP